MKCRLIFLVEIENNVLPFKLSQMHYLKFCVKSFYELQIVRSDFCSQSKCRNYPIGTSIQVLSGADQADQEIVDLKMTLSLHRIFRLLLKSLRYCDSSTWRNLYHCERKRHLRDFMDTLRGAGVQTGVQFQNVISVSSRVHSTKRAKT